MTRGGSTKEVANSQPPVPGMLNPQVALLDRLLDITPPHLSRFFFANSGSEVVENAVKLARAHTGRTNIIAFDVRAAAFAAPLCAPPAVTAPAFPVQSPSECPSSHQLAMSAVLLFRVSLESALCWMDECVSSQGGYHGRTMGAMALTSSKTIYRQGFAPVMPQVRTTVTGGLLHSAAAVHTAQQTPDSSTPKPARCETDKRMT